ncbi:unnamed protein product [Zymoseptoria tritici ST99CH_1A5]|uniref:Stress response protein NST1 n=1 Tax=Zymoseptoria tritici ST99CH_1A5 TaxID=1276529 RepID=A0A1Y6LBL8_ZYMTR|nr:unnamed protein product [Zymoseptoria tritici ST99CH_3D1]SMY21009.1 unnamed protein product [Zymoseptoria tritici ST99CH_1A5]
MPPAMQAQNGVITAPPKGVVGGNRKKQKRRAKQAAKVATQGPTTSHDGGQAADGAYDDDQLGYPEDDEYSDDPQYDEDERYAEHPTQNGHIPQHHLPPPDRRPKNSRKKKQASQGHLHRGGYDSSMLPPMPHAPPPRSRALRPGQSQHSGNHLHPNIWNTSSQQERQNIKDFWLSLSEDERKALLKIEKEAVLKKMKQQQKHSCSCTVCGRKRTAIEEELEVLYEGYYEELEQYAHHDQPPLPNADGMMPDPLQHRRPHPLQTPPPTMQYRKTSHLHEHLDEEEEYSDEGEEEYSDEEEEDDEEYSDEEQDPEPEPPRAHQGVPDFFNFGSHLTVKDNLLTVADDLLKNDGRKFIEMMEQLAERRMQRESRSQYEAEHNAYPPDDPSYGHGDPLAEGDEFDDDEGSYDSQEEYDDDMDEEDEMAELTEEQRMQEGRRMFQIFAARMFEQRVLQAYREKVAAERQRKLLEELEDEDKQHAQREAKRQRDAQKKKDKKKQQQQAKAEEKAKRDAEKAAEEARLKEAEEKKLEEQRRRKEEQRRKREEEKKKQEEEKAKKEAEKLRRQQEEQQRREEMERKAREAKAAEKAKKEEAKRKEREEREAREKEAREHKAHIEKERKDHEAKLRAQAAAKDREKQNQPTHANPPQITKRPSQAGMVAVPGVHSKNAQSGVSSPHPTVAKPVVPKPIQPSKQRQASQQGSLASSPKGPQSQQSSAPSKSSSPASSGPKQNPIQPKTIMQKSSHPSGQFSQPPMPTSSPLPPHHPLQPPPGMPHMQQQHPGGFPGMGPMGFPGFGGPQGPAMPNLSHRGPMQMFPQQGPHMGMPNRMPFGPGMNGIGPPGMMMQPNQRIFPFDGPGSQPPPGFGHTPHPALPQQTSPIGPPQAAPGGEQRSSTAGHSRQPSLDKERFESTANQPISRPAPIKRPGSDKPPGADRSGPTPDVDDLSKHLGSSALLDDTDEPMPPNLADVRRHSSIAPGAGARNISIPSSTLGQMAGGFGNAVVGNPLGPAPFANWNGPGMTGMPFGQSPNLAQPNWGSLPNGSLNNNWSANNSAFGVNVGTSTFGNMSGHPGQNIHRPSAVGLNRPLTIRLAVCQACKQLSNNTSRNESSTSSSPSNANDGFHDVHTLLRQIESNRPMLDSPPTLREIEEICETEGDHQNGGGELYVRRTGEDGGSKAFSVKWEPDVLTPEVGGRTSGGGGLGEIGSPLPSKTSPAGFGFGAPGRGRVVTGGGPQGVFQGLGAV